jgi:hypothetical protein
MMSVLPTSDMETFKKQVSNPNVGFDKVEQKIVNQPQQVKKNLVLSYISDYTGCGHIRNILPTMYLNSVFGRGGDLQVITSPTMIFQPDILQKTRSVFFQRVMGPGSDDVIRHYKELQNKYQFKMIYDLDDFIWDGDDVGEEIPKYNFGKKSIDTVVQKSAIENMKMMDTVTVTTQFLKDYIASKGVDYNKIEIVHNSLPNFLWNSPRKAPITKRIEKPTVLWSASPTHWHDGDKLKGDMDNAWYEWVRKSVIDGKINYIQMGGCPWFFEDIKDKITVIDWVNSLHYPKTVMNLGADFGLSVLVPNYFNYSKSAIKYQEYCLSGILGIGTVFSNGKPSPYDISLVKAIDTITVEDIDKMFNELCEPEVYNRLIDAQYKQVIDNHWITESKGFVDRLTSIF